MKKTGRTSAARKPSVIGWREHVGLPEFGIATMPAKIDTGARTSALHAVDQVLLDIDGVQWVEFMIPIHNRRTKTRLRARLLEERMIKNTGGVAEKRFVVRTKLRLGRRSWLIDVSLANREKMEFDLILGRTALRRRGLLIDPGHSFVLDRTGAPTKNKTAPPIAFARASQGEQQ